MAPAALVCDEFVNSLLHLEKMPRVSSTMSKHFDYAEHGSPYYTVSASSGHNRKCRQGALILLVVHPPTLRCAAYTRDNFIFKMF